MTCLQRTSRVLIVSSSPIYASAFQQLIESSPLGGESELVLDPHALPPLSGSPSDLILLAPRDWRELGEWICPLHKKLHSNTWLFLAERRMLGMFVPRLNSQPCAVVDLVATPSDLLAALRAIADTACLHLPTTFLSHFARSAAFRPGFRAPRMPSIVELAVSCGVSLGLSNLEIAAALLVSEATVKTHLHRLMIRMKLTSRAELADLVTQALTFHAEAWAQDRSSLVCNFAEL